MRRATWILWLMLALLPLRGWALAGMGLPQALPASMQAMTAEAGEHRAMPCHQADDGADAATVCQACDGCHTAIAAPPTVDAMPAPILRGEPEPVAQRDTGRALIDGLERPPRSELA